LLDGQTTLEEIGIRVERYRVGGIGARYDRWLQLLADMLGRPVTRTALSTPAPLGAAILAGIGLGVWPHYKEAVRAMVRPTEEFTPDERRHGRYARGLATYRRWRARLSEGDAEGA
jgi:sugar (pentulose or hexulose) kinase